ncbi:hypothetical protein ILUMI_18167, partial [Ignelater luminosus]
TENSEVSCLNVNEAAVMARIMMGSGYAHMEETAATLNMPCMSKAYYHKLQNKMYHNIHTAAWQHMRKASEKESAIAVEQGNVDADGIPCITSSWRRRQQSDGKLRTQLPYDSETETEKIECTNHLSERR